MRNLILLALSALSVPAHAGSPFIWGSNNGEAAAVSLPDKICFQSGECLSPGTVPVSSVGASAPVQSSGGSTPVISMPAATSGNDGYLTSGDWSTFNAKAGLNQVWSLSGNAGSGGSILGTTDAVDLTIQTNGFNQMVMSQSGGWESNQSFDVPDSTSKTQYYLSSSLVPTIDTPASNRTSLGVNLDYDLANAGHSLGGSLVTISPRLSHGGSGSVSYGSLFDGSFNLTNGGTLDLFKGVNVDGSIQSGYTVNQYNGLQSNLNTDGSILGFVALLNTNSNLQNVTAGNVNSQTSNLNIGGTSTITQGVTGISSSATVSDSVVIAGTLQGASISQAAQDTSVIQNINGIISSIQVEDLASVGSINGVPVSIDVRGTSSVGSVSTVNLNTQVRENANVVGGVTSLNVNSNIDNNAVIQSYTGSNVNTNTNGAVTADNLTLGNFSANIAGASVIQNVSGVQSNIAVSGTASTGNLTGAYVNVQTLNTATVNSSITGAQVQVSTATPQNSVTGLTVDVQNASLTPAQLDTGAQVMAITSQGGSFSVNGVYNPPAAVGFFQTHYLGGNTTVANGAPISAYGFGNNFAHSITFNDDWTPDFTGLRLGYVDVGFVGAVTGATGKTMDSWTGALGGFGNPSGAGVIDQAIMFRAAGGLSQGGSLSINNAYGFQAMPTLCAIATNCWALFDDSGADNYVSKLAIGTATKKAASGVALDVVGRAAFTEGAQLTTSGSQPTCDATARGLMWNIEGGAGVADILQICQKDAADAYGWVTK